MPAGMPNLQEATSTMNSTQLQGYLHQASKIMEQASNNSVSHHLDVMTRVRMTRVEMARVELTLVELTRVTMPMVG